jgi:hypothetical protein
LLRHLPAPKRHLTRNFGVLSSHAAARSAVVPAPAAAPAPAEQDKAASTSKYIPWAELLRKTFGFEIDEKVDHHALQGVGAL